MKIQIRHLTLGTVQREISLGTVAAGHGSRQLWQADGLSFPNGQGEHLSLPILPLRLCKVMNPLLQLILCCSMRIKR